MASGHQACSPPSAEGVSAATVTCPMLLSSKQGVQICNCMINGSHTSCCYRSQGRPFSCFFLFFFSLPLFICVELGIFRWHTVKYKGWLHTCAALLSGTPAIVEKQSLHSCCWLGKLRPFSVSGLFLHISVFLVGFPRNDFSEETCKQRSCGFHHTHLVDCSVTGFSLMCILRQQTPLCSLQSAEARSAT